MANQKLGRVSSRSIQVFPPQKKEQTRAMELGSTIHAAILEPEVFKKEYMLLKGLKDRRQPEYKGGRKAKGEVKYSPMPTAKR